MLACAQLGSAQKLETMASVIFSPVKSRFLLASSVLLLFTPPIFSLLVFFWPLIVSTVLGVLAVVSFGQHGISTGQEEGISENLAASPDMVVSSANVEEISDVLMVGNQEVTWLEWLHNEDMEKCRAQERANCMSARWDVDELDVACEASMGTLASRVEEKSMVDAYAQIMADQSYANEQTARAADASFTAVPNEGIWVTTQVDSLGGLVSPFWDVSRADANGHLNEDVDVVKTNGLSFKVADATRECALSDKAVNMTRKDRDRLVAEVALEVTAFTTAVSNGSESRYAERDEVETIVDGQVLALRDESVAHAFASEVRDATSTSRGGSKLDIENEASECTSDGKRRPLSLTSEAISTTDALEASFAREALEGQEMQHIKEEAEEQDSKESNKGPVWDVSDEEETKSSLRFSFFNNGCLNLTPGKHEAEGSSDIRVVWGSS